MAHPSISSWFPFRLRFLTVSLAGTWLLLASCTRSSSNTSDGRTLGEDAPLPDGGLFHRAAMLQSIGSCVLDRYRAFETSAGELDSAAAIAAADPSEEHRTDVRNAWIQAMDLWEQLELFQFGPAASNAQPGGRDLRASIYSWPL